MKCELNVKRINISQYEKISLTSLSKAYTKSHKCARNHIKVLSLNFIQYVLQMLYMKFPFPHDSIKVTNQYYFGYWKVIFFLADHLPLGMNIEKKLKRVCLYLYMWKNIILSIQYVFLNLASLFSHEILLQRRSVP